MGLLERLSDAASGAGGEPDLSAWATQNGLIHHDRDNVVGYGFALKEDGNDVRRNVLTGTLPGGVEGVIFHNAAGRIGVEGKYGRTTEERRFTQVAAFVPEAIAGFQRFAIPVEPQEPPGWSEIPASDLGIAGRHFLCSPNVDFEALTALMRAGLAERINALDPAVTPNFRFGTLMLAAKGLDDAPRIEARCRELAAWVEIFRAAAPPVDDAALAAGLPAPFFVDPSFEPGRPIAPAPPYPTTGDVDGVGLDQPIAGGWRELAVALGNAYPESGLVPEDTLSFYRAFPRFPVPGQAVLVARGTLPGTDIPGRTVLLADNYRDSVNLGFDAFVVPAAGAADTPGPYSERGALRYAVRDGWASIWRPRPASRSPHLVDPGTYRSFAAEAAGLIGTNPWETGTR